MTLKPIFVSLLVLISFLSVYFFSFSNGLFLIIKVSAKNSLISTKSIDTSNKEEKKPVQTEINKTENKTEYKKSFSSTEVSKIDNKSDAIDVKELIIEPTAEPQIATEISKPEEKSVGEISQVKNYTPSLTIDKIGLNQVGLAYESLLNLNQLYAKMLNNPIIESHFAADICTLDANSYILGHSEPGNIGDTGPGVYVFSRLEELEIGDIINVESGSKKCSYRVTSWDFVRTSDTDQITKSQFNKLFYPETNGKSLLTIQTCQKGSSTVRLILRAEMI